MTIDRAQRLLLSLGLTVSTPGDCVGIAYKYGLTSPAVVAASLIVGAGFCLGQSRADRMLARADQLEAQARREGWDG